MKKSIITLVLILLVSSMTFAQRGNWNMGNDNVQTVTGTVTDNTRPCGFLTANDGKTYKIHLGPIWFWNQNNYALALTTATIKGNVKEINGEYSIYPYTITQDGKTMTFADDNGIPKWSQGKGKGYGKGYGKGNNWGRGNNRNCPYGRNQ